MPFSLLLFILVLCNIRLYSQSGFSAAVSIGPSFNNNLQINQQKVNNSHGWSFLASGLIDIPVTSSFFLETGLYGKIVIASGRYGYTDYNSQAIRLGIPLFVGIPINQEITIYPGIVTQSNKDFIKFRVGTQTNLRYYAVLKGNYRLNERLGIEKSIYYAINTPDLYLVNDPKFTFLLGINYRFGLATQKKSINDN